jgi:hypothetical protein
LFIKIKSNTRQSEADFIHLSPDLSAQATAMIDEECHSFFDTIRRTAKILRHHN